MIFITVKPELPVKGFYFRHRLPTIGFFAELRHKRKEIVSRIPYIALAKLLSSKVGFTVPAVMEYGEKFALEKGDKVLVVMTDDYEGISTGRGLRFDEIVYLGTDPWEIE